MTKRFRMWAIPAAAVAATLCASSAPAQADLQICSRMSYAVEAALGIEEKGAVASRGWFRIDPGQCRNVLSGKLEAETLYLHARALAVYGASPLPQGGHADLCVANGDFVLAGARTCNRPGQSLARFTAVRPSLTEQGLTAYLAEDAEYTDEQARDAGIQRLLAMAGYDAGAIDGIRGSKTDVALTQFFQDNKFGSPAPGRSDLFDLLIAAAQRPDGTGFAWCNETPNQVMAALGVEDKGAVTTRGWYRIEPGKCLRPDLHGQPRRVFSYAEAVGADGQALKSADRPIAWGGEAILCTRNTMFELSDHKDCTGNGLTASGFTTIDLGGRGSATIRLR
jgi:uncharacterized membrane protein